MAEPIATIETPEPYIMTDPRWQPAYRPPGVQWIEGDHPTENPDGVTNRTWITGRKARKKKPRFSASRWSRLIDLDPNEPYPIGDPIGEDGAFAHAHPDALADGAGAVRRA